MTAPVTRKYPRLSTESVKRHAQDEGLTLRENARGIPGVPTKYTLYLGLEAGATFYANANTLAEAMNLIEARAATRRAKP